MRQVDLSALPRTNGKQNRIAWFDSVGLEVPFECDGVVGVFEIEDVFYKGKDFSNITLKLSHNDKKSTISVVALRKGQIKRAVNGDDLLWGCDFYMGQIIKTDTAHMELLEPTKIKQKYNTVKGFKYKCLKCGYVGEKSSRLLKTGTGCARRRHCK